MNTEGKLILLTGFFGSGKSTLADYICSTNPEVKYYTTITTRPPRGYESILKNEYHFVNEEKYHELRTKSSNWDHGEMNGHYYGQDIETAQDILKSGVNLLRCILPDLNVINRIARCFPNQVKLIWIDTPLEVANARLSKFNDELRTKRIEGPLQTNKNRAKIIANADYIFHPVGLIDQDTKKFRQFINDVLDKK